MLAQEGGVLILIRAASHLEIAKHDVNISVAHSQPLTTTTKDQPTNHPAL
jgi:hypothetical protein